ncbi:hypothetical protein NEF87_000259 [Candidatus Lokiarchaeum ossiferum]|uniref:NADP transhydrogenase subunit alpha n=1 Tax=Candidatus Lokiarchaeum ossiferum TaxID=2951803 RepID=A0ABY6HKC6_9ARCH|nr:hypothetical protein NEF87_000259 [Candidatus Lokiarchaeum sp. B-35]
MKSNEITIIGAGNGGRAFAVYLSDLGFKVKLGFRTYENISTILRTGKIVSKGLMKGIYPIGRISPNYVNLIHNSKYIFIVVPAHVHIEIIERILPSLSDGQILILNPGRTFGAVEVYNFIKRKRPNLRIKVAETQSLLFTCRKISDSGVDIIKIKNSLDICFYPEREDIKIQKELKTIFPQLNFVSNILETSLNNIGALLHPTISILNAGAILRKNDFFFYRDVSLQIANVIKEMDKERCLILNKLGIRPKTFLQWVRDSYNVNASNYFEAFRIIEPYKKIKAPKDLNNRYLMEEVPTGLIPLSSLGKYLNIPTPIIDSFITLAGSLLGVNFYKNGRTLSRIRFPINNYLQTFPQKKVKGGFSRLLTRNKISASRIHQKSLPSKLKGEYLTINK